MRIVNPSVCGVLIAALVSVAAAQAQSSFVEIVSTDPPEGAVNVEPTKRVTFRLNKPLPAFGSQFADKFIWSPQNATRLTTFGHDFDDEGKLTIIFFTLEHEPATDVTFIALGIRANDGSRMQRPYVLNYTTAASKGTHVVSGTAAFGERVFAPSSSKRQALEGAVRRTLRPVAGTPQIRTDDIGRAAGNTPTLPRASAQIRHSSEMRRTVVLLLERYSLDESRWRIHKAAVPDESGSFSIADVREGTYWPVAINFAGDEGEVIGSYGFYDADADVQPDPIEVAGESVSDVRLELYSASPFTARANVQLARDIAGSYAADQQLMNVMALQGPDLWEAYPDGRADMWRYTFYSASERLTTVVAIDPINVYVDTDEETTYDGEPLPEPFVDTDAAVEVADRNGGAAFQAQYPDDAVRIVIEGGDLALRYRPAPSEVFWMVQYQSPAGAEFESDTVFVDAATGAILPGVPVATQPAELLPSAFSLSQNYPNPFNPSTKIHFQIERGGRVTLSIFNAAGQEVDRPVDRYLTPGRYDVAWNGDNLPSGTYFYRLRSSERVVTKRMVMIK